MFRTREKINYFNHEPSIRETQGRTYKAYLKRTIFPEKKPCFDQNKEKYSANRIYKEKYSAKRIYKEKYSAKRI